MDEMEPQGERSGEDHATPDEKTGPAVEIGTQPRAWTCTPQWKRHSTSNGGETTAEVRNLRNRRARDRVTLHTTPISKGRPLELVIRPQGSTASQPHLKGYTGGETSRTSESPESLQA